MKIIAMDIGGTTIKYGFLENNEVTYGQFPVKDACGIENIPKSVCELAVKYNPDYVAISAPGPFDYENGTGLMTHKLLSMYQISLKEELDKAIPGAETLFVHDSTAFAVGVMSKHQNLKQTKFASVMLGTGLGYTCVNNGKVLLNKKQTPLHPLWNRPFKNGISEDYVSTRALRNEAEKIGMKFNSVREMADEARQGNQLILKIFFNYGANLGICIMNAMSTDSFSELFIGGQISRSWDLMREGFEQECKVKYTVIDDPVGCAIDGLYECATKGKDVFCEICEE